MRMRSDTRCALSGKGVLGADEPFFVFPSGFVFLSSSLKKEVLPYLNEKQQARLADLERRLHTSGEDDKSRVAIQREIDGLVAAECPLTGSIMVDSIDRDFNDCEEVPEPDATE